MWTTSLFSRQLEMNAVFDARLIPHPEGPMAHHLPHLLGLGFNHIDLVQHVLGAHFRKPASITTVCLGTACRHGARARRVHDMHTMPLFLNPACEPPGRAAHLYEHIGACRHRFPKRMPFGRVKFQGTQATFAAIDLMLNVAFRKCPMQLVMTSSSGSGYLTRPRRSSSSNQILLGFGIKNLRLVLVPGILAIKIRCLRSFGSVLSTPAEIFAPALTIS